MRRHSDPDEPTDPHAETVGPEDHTLEPENSDAPPMPRGLATPGAETLGPYRILRELGRGGMGVVYHARRDELKKDYALKVILAGQDASPDAIARFRREAQAAAQLGSHPGIVGVHDIGESEGRTYFAMDFVRGRALEEVIDAGDVDHRTAAGFVEQAARALHFAHAHGIVHRDVKPANLMVDESGAVRVADFGLATAQDAGPGSHRLTKSGAVLGTPAYMPPEQAAGAEHLDARADVWALGATLYELLVGEPPFQADSIYGLLAKISRDDPSPPTKRDPRVPRDLETIALKCLQKDADARYPTADALAADLARWSAGEPIAARPVGRLERIGKHVRRHRVPWVVGAVAAAILLLVVGAVGVRAAQEAAREEAHLAGRLATALEITRAAPERALALLLELEQTQPNYPGVRDARAAAEARVVEHARERAVTAAAGSLRLGLDRARAHADELAKLVQLMEEFAVARLGGRTDLSDAEIRTSRERLDRHYSIAQATLGAAREGLRAHADLPEFQTAVSQLVTMAWARVGHAERTGTAGDAAPFLKDLEIFAPDLPPGDAAECTVRLRGDGRLSLSTAPSGATVECRRYRENPDGRLLDAPYDPRARAFADAPVTLGTTPLHDIALPRGSYLLILRSAGKRDTRYPVNIDRNESETVRQPIPLHSAEAIGDGFVYVPPGETWFGGDPKAFRAWPRHQRWVDGFCLAAHEVTTEEYLTFLVRSMEAGTLSEEAAQKMVPRRAPEAGPFWKVENQRCVGPTRDRARWPIVAISWHDAMAYCAWRSKRDGRAYTLPSSAEWVRAARGADRRAFVTGDRFDWRWVCGGRSPIHAPGSQQPQPVGSIAADRSVFGVYDLGGNVQEWCRNEPNDYPGSRAVRGGAWGYPQPSDFRLANRDGAKPGVVKVGNGFRLRTLPRTE